MVARRKPVNPARGTARQRAVYNATILARDDFTCRLRLPGICIGIATTVDHIIPVSVAPHLALDLDNGRASCKPCNRARGVMPDTLITRDYPPSRAW